MIADQLKKAVLQAAIQGKLTDQFPEDGDASKLLEEIEAEKARRVKEGKNKKRKPLPAITEDEIPFDIPENWCWVRFGLISKITNGFTPSRSNKKFWNSKDIPWFTIKDIREQGRIITYTEQFISNSAINNSARIVPANSVLLCCTASVGEYAITKIDLTTNQQFNGISVFDGYKKIVSPLYMFFYVQTLSSQLIAEAGQTTFPFLSTKKLANFIMPLPPISEQKRIIEIMEEILPEIESLHVDESSLQILQQSFPTQIKSSILQAAIQGNLTQQLPEDGDARDLLEEIKAEKGRLIKAGKIKKEKPLPETTDEEIPFDIPDNWCWTRLGDVTEIIMGQSPDSSSVGEKTGIEFHQGKKHFSDKLITDSGRRCSTPKKISPADSLLLCVRAPVGIVNITDREICIGRGLASIRGYGIISTEFLYFYLSSITKYFIDRSTGSTFKAINQKTIKESIIALPPLAEQERIVTRLEELLPLCDALE
jgi:type I restriction enzyme, S subunit